MSTENPFQAPVFHADRTWPAIPSSCRTLLIALLLSPFFVGVLLQLGISEPRLVGVRSGFGVPRCLTIDHHRPTSPRIVFHGRAAVVNCAMIAIGAIALALILRNSDLWNLPNGIRMLPLACVIVISGTMGFLRLIPIGEQYQHLFEAAILVLFFTGTWATSVFCNSYSFPFLISFAATTIWGVCRKGADLYSGDYDSDSMESFDQFLQRSALALGLSVISCLCIFLFRRKGRLQSWVH